MRGLITTTFVIEQVDRCWHVSLTVDFMNSFDARIEHPRVPFALHRLVLVYEPMMFDSGELVILFLSVALLLLLPRLFRLQLFLFTVVGHFLMID